MFNAIQVIFDDEFNEFGTTDYQKTILLSNVAAELHKGLEDGSAVEQSVDRQVLDEWRAVQPASTHIHVSNGSIVVATSYDQVHAFKLSATLDYLQAALEQNKFAVAAIGSDGKIKTLRPILIELTYRNNTEPKFREATTAPEARKHGKHEGTKMAKGKGGAKEPKEGKKKGGKGTVKVKKDKQAKKHAKVARIVKEQSVYEVGANAGKTLCQVDDMD